TRLPLHDTVGLVGGERQQRPADRHDQRHEYPELVDDGSAPGVGRGERCGLHQLTARTAPLAKAARMASGGSPPHPTHRVDLSLEGEVTGGEAMPLRYPSLWGRDNAGPGEDAYPLVEMPLLDQALCLQPVGRDGGGGFAAHLYAAV